MTTETLPILSCPDCHSTEIVKAGFVWSGRKEVQRYRCNKCGRTFIEPCEERKENEHT